MENWKPVLGYEGYYEVSNEGNVRSLPRVVEQECRWGGKVSRVLSGRILKPHLSSGYRAVHLCSGGAVQQKQVHRLVLESFVGDPMPGEEACHCDGDRLNNNVSNLRWDTRSNNHRDKTVHGTDSRGERNPASKISNIEARFIKFWLKSGFAPNEIAKGVGVSPSIVKSIKYGATWGWLNT